MFQSLSIPIIISFVAYSFLMLGIGFYFYQQNQTAKDYFLGGRGVGPFVSALSAGASDMSAWLLLGLPGALYTGGFVEFYIAIGLTIGATINWLFVAKRLKIYTSIVGECITIPDFFEMRFSDDKHILRLVSAIVILVFFTIYISSGLVGGAKLFEATFGLNYEYALTIGTAIIVAYTFLGGYKAVCWTDMVQGLLMMSALIILAIVMLIEIGGFKEASNYIRQSDLGKEKILQFQNEIPSLLEMIEKNPKEVAQKLTPLIQALNETQDSNLGLQNAKILANSLQAKQSKILNHQFTQKTLQSLQKDLITLQKLKLKPTNRLSFSDHLTWISLISALAWGLGYFGQPHILVRFMSIRSIKEIPIATGVGISWMAVSLIAASMIGILGIAYINKFNLSLQDPEEIFIVMSQTLFNPWIAGILLSAILAAIMSTASSQLLVSSSTIAQDFYRRIFNQNAPAKIVMAISRISVFIVSIVAFLLSMDRSSGVLSIVSYAWAGFGASFGSVILFSLFWSRMTRIGAIAGMIGGAITVVVYKNFLSSFLPIYEIVPGFLVASVCIVLFSLILPVRERTKQTFDLMFEEIRK